MGPEFDHVNAITEKIIGCAFKVSNTLGSGFLEKVYENTLAIELRTSGLAAEQQAAVEVCYEGISVGLYFADILVNQTVIVEVKAVKNLDDVHLAQALNYLKATGKTICLLLNFSKPKVEIKRVVRSLG